MLAPALRGHVGNRAFDDLEQRLLDALARDIAGDGWIIRLTRDFIDFIDIDDAAFGACHIEVGRLY